MELDGIDLDWEDNVALEAGTGEELLVNCTRLCRAALPFERYILSRAPMHLGIGTMDITKCTENLVN